jgi:hypothetical protein
MANPFDKYLGPEDHVQLQVCEYVRLQYRGAEIHHSPNEGKRSKFEQYKISRLGVSSGFPDLFIVYKGKAIAPELKAGKNKATVNQERWIRVLNDAGIPSKVCTGFDEAKKFIDQEFKKT